MGSPARYADMHLDEEIRTDKPRNELGMSQSVYRNKGKEAQNVKSSALNFPKTDWPSAPSPGVFICVTSFP